MLNQYDWVLKVQNASDTKMKKKKRKKILETQQIKSVCLYSHHICFTWKNILCRLTKWKLNYCCFSICACIEAVDEIEEYFSRAGDYFKAPLKKNHVA